GDARTGPAAVDARVALPAPDARRPIERIDAGVSVDAGALVAGATFRLTVSPQESEVQLGGGPWRVLEDGTVDLPVPTAPLRVSVRKEDCCEGKVVTIPAGQTRPFSITNPFLPASITPMCDAQGDISVTIDGANANLGRGKTIFFGDTLVQQKDVEVAFFIGDRIDRQTITVRPKSSETVRCRP
ncbi:MAG: hypothetical protein K8M05_13215, partial [Deltaproteobacteria bacterium]|nr:hypothetical protein [Kofleriaceae bacterium]